MILADIRQALADTLGSIGAVNVYPYIVDAPITPSITVAPDGEYVAYWGTFSDQGHADLRLQLLVRLAGPVIDAQQALDGYLSVGTVTSIIDVLNADRTLGGVVSDCKASTATAIARVETPEGGTFYTAAISLQIITVKGA